MILNADRVCTIFQIMSNVILRPCQPGEIIPVDLLRQSEPILEELNKYIDNSVGFVAEVENSIIGVCLMVQVNPETIELKNISVYPSHRNMGVGSSLIEFAADMATEAGCLEIIAGTDNTNASGMIFLQKLGFDMDSIEKNYYRNYTSSTSPHRLRSLHRVWFLRHLKSDSES